VWRLVLIDQKATLHELETNWSWMDMMNAIEIIDAFAEAEAEWREKRDKKK
jgi:hypothetical protein